MIQRPLLNVAAIKRFSKLFHLLRTCKNIHLRSSSGRGMQSPREQSNSGDEVLFEEVRSKGIITLNRPKALNALNLGMISKIYPVLRSWEESNKQLVIIKGAGGKAFCAGGDVRAVTESAKEGSSLYKDFFKAEYILNNLIGTLQVPYIALIDGITMGGGVGLSVHGPYRVSTERTLFAMPETGIGLFPDVGGSYFLPRLGGKLGLYLALTGYRLKGGDVLKAGVSTHMCPSHMLDALEQDLISLESNKPADIEKVLHKYHSQCPQAKEPFSLQQHTSSINSIFSAPTMEQILSNLEQQQSPWAKETLGTLRKMSPTSLKISLKLLEAGASLDLQECLQMEYRLTQRCCEDHDFIEGVRALLVDKDQTPKWKPASLEGVSEGVVDKYFSPLEHGRELMLS